MRTESAKKNEIVSRYSNVSSSWIQAPSQRAPFASRSEPETARPSFHQSPATTSAGQRLAHPLEQPVHHVEVVEQAAEEALGEGAHDVGVARADGRLDLLGLAAAGRLDQLARDVAAADDLARARRTARTRGR